MDGGERGRQSQYGAPYQSSGAGRPAPGRPMGPPSQETYSQTAPSPSRSDMATPSAARPYMSGYQYNYQDPQFQSQLQYSPSYVQDTSRAHHVQPPPSQQHYTPYGQTPMLPPVGQHQMYQGLPSYQQQRQSAAIEVMAGQFGGLPHYLQPGESSSVGVAQPSSEYLSSQPESSYGSMALARPQLQAPFAPSSTEYGLVEQSNIHPSQEEMNSRQAMEEGRRQYEQQLRVVFQLITSSNVSEASDKLAGATEWLVGSVRPLGLHHDDEENHAQRLLLWKELNHAWEALGQRQKTITEEALRTRRQPRDILSSTTIQALIDKLVAFCDQLERYGLVDYEMGIWEEQIVSIFIQCLDLLPQEQAREEPRSDDR